MLSYRDYILAVARCRSFTKAAEMLHVSQPWLSSAVKKTEQEIGLPLFDRSTAPISLTEAGKYYVEQAGRVAQLEEEMRSRFIQLRAQAGGELRIGSSMFFCTYVLPSLLADFRGEHPDIALRLIEGGGKELADRLQKGEIDLLLEVEKTEQKGCICEPWSSEEILLAVPGGNPLNARLKEYAYSFEEWIKRDFLPERKPAVPLAHFAREPFLMLGEGHDIHRRSLELCRKAGFVPSVKLELSQMMTAYYLVCEGQGVSFLRSTIPDYVTPTESIVFYELGDPLAARSIYLAYTESGNLLKQALIQYLKNHAAP